MRTLLISLLTITTLTNAKTQDVVIDTNVLSSQAKAMTDALIAKDYKTFVRFVYPKVIKLGGGEENMIKLLESGMETLKNQGFTFKSCSVGTLTKLVKAGSEFHALVPQQIIIETKTGTLLSNSFLLAISADAGKTWKFIDLAKVTDENVKQLLPNYNAELKIPEKQPPIFQKNQ